MFMYGLNHGIRVKVKTKRSNIYKEFVDIFIEINGDIDISIINNDRSHL
jgi:hypothetical protein